jgi:hypothetical protein
MALHDLPQGFEPALPTNVRGPQFEQMQSLFRKRCDELVHSYVYASLKRDCDVREICMALDERSKRDRRVLCKRIASLEREQHVSDKKIEDLAWEIELLNFKLKGLGLCVSDEIRHRLEALERSGCESEVVVAREGPKFTDELGWTQI